MQLKETENTVDSNLDCDIYKLLFDSIDSGFCVIEMKIQPDEPIDYKFIEVNRAFEEQSTLKNAKGKWMRELRPNHEEYWFETYRNVAISGKPLRYENKGRELDDRWFSVYAFRVGEPEELKVAVIFSDITAQKLSEEKDAELQKSEERLRIALEAGEFGTWELDLNNSSIFHNLRHDQIFGYKEFQNDWTLEKLSLHFVPEDRDIVRMALNRPDDRGRMSVEGRIRWHNDSIHWIHLFGRFQYDKTRKPVKLIGLISDITERKRIEEELIKSEERLTGLNASKDKFLSIIGHDLKGSFTSILGFADLLIEKFQNADLQDAEEYAKIIQKSSWNTFNLLTNLFEWAKMQAGRMDFKPEEIDLVPIINEAIELFNASIRQKSLTVINNIETLPIIIADKQMISTVFRNLISNAVKFSFSGGIISISATINEDDIYVEIKDNGTGMTEDTQADLFTIDTGLSSKGTQNEEGTGLGLILCKEFIEKHGGEIWAESEAGHGSRFTFTLPLNKK